MKIKTKSQGTTLNIKTVLRALKKTKMFYAWVFRRHSHILQALILVPFLLANVKSYITSWISLGANSSLFSPQLLCSDVAWRLVKTFSLLAINYGHSVDTLYAEYRYATAMKSRISKIYWF